MNLKIVKFATEHVAEVAAIEAASYRDPWSESSFHDVLILADTSWVAMMDGTVAGFLITQWVLDEIHVLNIAVKQEFRQQGVAAKLLTMLFDLSIQRGMREVFLEVRVSNTAAQSLYQKFGFSVLATRKGYYPDGEDANIMYRSLPAAEDGNGQATIPMNEPLGDRHGD